MLFEMICSKAKFYNHKALAISDFISFVLYSVQCMTLFILHTSKSKFSRYNITGLNHYYEY